MLTLISLLCFALSASATSILLPLYVYPSVITTPWNQVYKVIAAYPSVQWQIIINPDTGPGTNSSNPYPNDDYIEGIKSLTKYPNVQTLGYVDTLWGKRDISDVKLDIDRFAVWAKYSRADIAMDGIFFDDVPSIHDFNDSPGTQASNETYFQSITSYAVTTIPTETTPVVCNSGNPGPSSFFQYCDTVIEFENKWTTYKGQTTLNSITSDGGVLNHSAILAYNVPLDSTAVTSTIRTLAGQGVQFVGFTSDCCWNAANGTLLDMVASACNTTNTELSTHTAHPNTSGRDVVPSAVSIGLLTIFLSVFGSF